MKTKLTIFIVLLAACNLTINPAELTYMPSRVLAGDWWRVLTHCFVHVSWYHLLMDAGAFALLWHALQLKGAPKRAILFSACLLGSILAATLASPLNAGLCGLSGIAHGLMAFSALEYASDSDPTLRRCGWISLAAVVLKSMWEAATGNVFFAGLHFGNIADPIAACHAGGTLGALCAWPLLSRVSTCSRVPRARKPAPTISQSKKPVRIRI